MSHRENVITIFVASPSDVNSERDTLEKVIQEINQTWSRELKVRFDLIRWETHAHPDIGHDAQDVINKQIPEDYDIFIGLMWHRFGSPTKRAGSGTEEEFLKALEKHEADPNKIKLMFYFKDTPVSPSKLNTEQLQKVNEFRTSLGDEGVLYWTFKDIDEFERLSRIHLTRKIQDYQKTGIDKKSEKKKEKSESDQTEDELGFLDLIEISETRFNSLIEISNRIAEYTHDVADDMNRSTQQINELTSNAIGNVKVKSAKRLISKAASDLDHYAERMEAEFPLFSKNFNEGIDAVIKASKLSVDFESSEEKDDQLNESLQSVKELNIAILQTTPSIKGFRDSINNLPRITSDINKAKRNTVNILDKYLDEFDTSLKLTNEAEKEIKRLLNN